MIGGIERTRFAGFTLVGPLFLSFTFSGAAPRRGNPVMGLIAGILLSALGLFRLDAPVSGRPKPHRGPRRLP
jgi:hypothetical protein